MPHAQDDHAGRARSLAAALVAIADTPSPVEPSALSALAEALEEHVIGMGKALGRASDILAGKGKAVAA
jgi:hypothetical protein